MSPEKALVIATVCAFTVLALAYQAVRLWQQAEDTITDALHELDEEGQQ